MSIFFNRSSEARSGSMAWWGAGIDTMPTNRRAVSENTAVHLAPVFAAIRHIVDFVSTLPVDVYRRLDDGTSQQMNNMPLLLRTQNAMGYPGLGNWIGQAVYGVAVHGNAVGWVTEADGYGFPTDVRWLRRQDWQYDIANARWLVYGAPVPSSQVLHIPWIVPSGCVVGMSPIDNAAATIAAGLSAQEYADVRRGGGIPPTVLKNNAMKLDAEQAESVRERAAAAFTSGKPFVTGSDWDLSLPGIPPNHAQFIETLQMSANNIAAMYGIDPREVGGTATDSLTYSTDESKILGRSTNLRPYITRIEDAINRVLPERQYVKLNTDATIRTEIETQTKVLGWQIADGRLSVNEARAIRDLPPVPGGDRHNFLSPAVAGVEKPATEPTRSATSTSEGEHHERR